MFGSRSQRLAAIAGFGPAARPDDGGHRHPAWALLHEADAINEATGATPLLSTSLVLAAWRGQEGRALHLIEASIEDATAQNEGTAIALAEYAQALLYNGLGRYQAALSAAERACRHEDVGQFDWALAELVEAGARGGSFEVAARALRRLEERPAAAGLTDSALGVRARSRALLTERENADVLY